MLMIYATSQKTQNICLTFVQCGAVETLGRRSVIQMFCAYWDLNTKLRYREYKLYEPKAIVK